jgi:hypothetical protein
MWTRIVLLSAVALGPWAAGTLAAQQSAPSPSLWARTDWARLEIVGGRIAVQSSRCGQCRLVVEPDDASDMRQTLSIQVHPAVVVVNYQFDDGRTQLSLEVDERKQLTLCRRVESAGPESLVRYIQPASGAVTLEVGSERRTRYSSASLWHLLLAQPQACEEHLLPMLGELRPHWRLAEQAAEVEAALVAQAGADTHAERRQWQAWVADLASDSFAARQAADLSLRQAGQSVLAFLRQQNPDELDPEQKRRIRGILTDVCDGSADSPERVAGWMLDDKAIWLTMLDRGGLEQRIAAAEHLSKLCRRSLPFDPSASPESRQAQLAVLREKLVEP